MTIQDKNITKEILIPQRVPLLPVRDIVVFPYMMIPLAVGRDKSIKALEKAMVENHLVFLGVQKKIQTEDPQQNDIYSVGCVAEILQLLKMPDGTLKILVEGIRRAKVLDFTITAEQYVEVEVKTFLDKNVEGPQTKALMRTALAQFEQYVKLNQRVPFEAVLSAMNISEAGRLADVIISSILVQLKDKQKIIEAIDVQERLEEIVKMLISENEILSIEKKIQGRVRNQIEKSQKEYYLTEQMKAIQKELKQKDEYGKEIEELKAKMVQAKVSKEAEEIMVKELVRLERMPPFSPEATVIRTYLDWLISLPWQIKTKDNLEIKRAAKILDEDHYGLDKAKERILQYLAVCKLTKKLKGPILCFVGPPGTGKTSLGRSIARALGRKFVRMSLGGMRDEAEIRGHRRTYIGALPGRIIQSIKKTKSKNPVFLLDEIDKIGNDFRGDPASALLEVLDPEQNSTFADHYLEVDFDLSDVMFVTTANTLYSIPISLQDRMEIIRFPGYTIEEKVKIAKIFLFPKQTKENGLTNNNLSITDKAIEDVVCRYTREAGVRNLEREIANICRKVAKEWVSDNKKEKIKITSQNLHYYLGIPKYSQNGKEENEIGVATGLAWTEVGGDTLPIEVSIMRGKGSLTLTGKLGEVMQESAKAALSYVRANSQRLGLVANFYQDKEIHIHVPEGAIPKDGPSAGIVIASALVSALTGIPVKKNVAMTGEITLRGNVFPVGGLKEKILAAHRLGMKIIVLPLENKKDMEEIPKNIQKKMKFVLVKNMDEVLQIALGGKLVERRKASSKSNRKRVC
ncbi:endopeptidase La [bacterium]|nr:endopeptidase La [bacterium]